MIRQITNMILFRRFRYVGSLSGFSGLVNWLSKKWYSSIKVSAGSVRNEPKRRHRLGEIPHLYRHGRMVRSKSSQPIKRLTNKYRQFTQARECLSITVVSGTFRWCC
jgi:hypothetical protein